VPNFAQSLQMLVLTTYPKMSSLSQVDLELQQKWLKLISIFHAKAITQKYIHALQKM
jgi:hypothetical protein